MRGVNQAGSQSSANQVPYNIATVFSPVFISFVNHLHQNAILIIKFILLAICASHYLLI